MYREVRNEADPLRARSIEEQLDAQIGQADCVDRVEEASSVGMDLITSL
jgi:hypothetical protein